MKTFYALAASYILVAASLIAFGAIRRWTYAKTILPAMVTGTVWAFLFFIWVLQFPLWLALLLDAIMAPLGVLYMRRFGALYEAFQSYRNGKGKG